jgi:hypothetical protein
VTYLCKDDAAPLTAIMEAAGDLPPDSQVPMPERDAGPALDVHKRGRRDAPMTPLLNWTPPGEPALTPVSTPERQWAQEAVAAEQRRMEKLAESQRAREEKEAEERRAREAREAEEAVVRDARAEGKTWKQITELLGNTTTEQNIWDKYHEKYKAKGPKPEPTPESAQETAEAQ